MLNRRVALAARVAFFTLLLSEVLTSASSAQPAASGPSDSSSYLNTVRCVNLDPEVVEALRRATPSTGLDVADAGTVDAGDRATAVIWEARKSADIDDAQADRLGDYVRNGGNLVLTLDEAPGKGVFRLRYLLPTTAWRTTLSHLPPFARAVRGAQWDSAVFPHSPQDSVTVPYFYTLRPFDTVERGQGRHEPLDQRSVVLSGTNYGGDFKSGDPVFTRPLINRDWQVRARTDDMGESALLITGRYGAGSVAVFASSARYMDPTALPALLTWMKSNQSAAVSPTLPPKQITSSTRVDLEHRALDVEITNHGTAAARLKLVSRMLTWENALIRDFDQDVTIAPFGETHVAIPMPPVNDTAYQALVFRDAFIVRSGLLSEDGRQICCEQRTNVDLRPAMSVSVMLDNLRAIPYPFKAPGYSGLSQLNERMGEPVMAYAYPPGAAISAVVRVCNGLRNIAPLAVVRDETQPDNSSTSAVNDECATAEKGPRDAMHSYGWWVGKADVDNSLLFTFPTAVTVNEIVLNGNPDVAHNRDRKNPGEMIVETDAGQVADVKNLDSAFQTDLGLVHVAIPSTSTQHIRVRFPWNPRFDDSQKREAPSLGEIEIIGWSAEPPSAVHGKLTVSLVDAWKQTSKKLAEQSVTLEPEREQDIPVHFEAEHLTDGSAATAFDRVEAKFQADGSNVTAGDAQPFMVIQPEHPLHSLTEARPPGTVGINFIVTRGFRNTFKLGTGTQQSAGGWESPDDLIWAYERLLKQTPKETVSTSDRLFVTEANFKHYSTPWSAFPNGEMFFDLAAPNLVKLAKADSKWDAADTVGLYFGDRWDTGPSGYNLYAWPELVQFDDYLASQNLPRLKGKTRQELTTEIQTQYDERWSAWQMGRYFSSVKSMRDAFQQAGKRLVISAQGLPLVPLKYLTELAQTIVGFSDDSTWGMWGENIPVTTGREMALMAFNPDWKVSEVLVPGYDSAAISTRFWAVVGTTESTRRHFYDPGWRGIIGSDGIYRCMNTFGFNMNGSSGYCMNLNDWQETWRLEERLSLLSPDGPLGAGVVVSNAAWDDPDHTTYSGGGMGDSEGDERIHDVAKAIGAFAEVGVPISFSSNVTSLGKWSGSAPLIFLGLDQLSSKEIETLSSLHQRGTPMIAVSGEDTIAPAVAALFGVAPDGTPTTGKTVGVYENRPVVATDRTLMISAAYNNLNTANLRPLLAQIKRTLSLGLDLPDGVGGYGFTMGTQRYIVLEDWREAPRVLQLRLRAAKNATRLLAVNVNDHIPLAATRDADDWVISVPTRPGDGTLVCVEEQ